MSDITTLWKDYNSIANLLQEKLQTSNIIGEYAEFLVRLYLEGELLTPSHPSADIKSTNGQLYQVKSRKIRNGRTTQLSIIRSWDFDFLTVVLFDHNGSIMKGMIYPKETAKKHAVANKYQNGWVITTNTKFLADPDKKDITAELRKLNKE